VDLEANLPGVTDLDWHSRETAGAVEFVTP
jgi:hypothetical protein